MIMLRDNVVITIRSGRGGSGSASVIKRTKFKKIPDGGNGGKGGDVVFMADNNVADLEGYYYNNIFTAKNGEPGSKNTKSGACGEDIILRVPCGTTIVDVDTGLCIRKLVNAGEMVIAVRGGAGGVGNVQTHAAKAGRPGEEMHVGLDFVLPTDVCIVGFPNVGKSRLLSMLTNSKVKVTEHPFTTQQPSLGTLVFEDYESVILCEIPSLVAGSSNGKGVGNKFIKHCSNAKILIYMLDPTSRFSHGIDEEYRVLRDELALYDDGLAEKNIIVVINKMDQFQKEMLIDTIERLENLYPTYCISLEKQEGVDALIMGIKEMLGN